MDPVVHVVLDSSVLVAYLLPETVDSTQLRQRAAALIDARVKWYWPTLRLWTAEICVAETMCAIDKYHLCDWSGPIKGNPLKRISKKRHDSALATLRDLVSNRRIELVQTGGEHTLATSLVSPVNYRYQVRRRRGKASTAKVKPPMGTADCVVIASASLLMGIVGFDSVVLVTADQRQADVSRKLRKLTFKAAKTLGLEEAAHRLGRLWTPAMYARAINLATATDSMLELQLDIWPFPDRHSLPQFDWTELSVTDGDILKSLYFELKRETKKGVDGLPFSIELDRLRARMAKQSGTYLFNADIYRALSSWRKAGKLIDPGIP